MLAKTVCARILIALCVATAPVTSCASTPPGAPEPRATEAVLERWIERIFGAQEFKPKSFGPARWVDGGRAYTTVEPSPGGGDDLVRYDVESGARSVLVPAEKLRPSAGAKPLAIEDYAWARDGRRLLVYTNSVKVWRQNTRGDYWVLDLGNGALRQLGGGAPESSLMFAKFDPAGTRVAYVRANDLWVEELGTGTITRLTSDGSDTIVNGTSDWVYEEELDVRDGFRWSPDGRSIAFWRFDSSALGIYPLVNDTDTLYPVVTPIPYPKAGTTNSAVRAGIVPVEGGEPRWVALPGDPRENYLARMEWVEKTGELLIQQLERRQRKNDVWLVDPATGTPRPLLTDRDEAWLDVVDDWRWLPGGEELLWVSDRDGWRHLWAVAREDGAWRLLTSGDFDVLGVAGIDEAGGELYFSASPADPARRYLYRVSLDGGAPRRVTPEEVGTHSYDIGPGGGCAFHTVSGIDRPPSVELVRLPGHEIVRPLETNAALAAALAELGPAPAEFFQLEIEPGVALDGWMVRPPDFDPARRYPLVLYVYGEPSAVQANDAWKGNRMLFHRALTHAGYVVACIDSRGSPAPRGRAWRKFSVGQPGILGAADQAAATRALLASRPYLDPERVASWGWSGGGTMTLNLLFRYPEMYRVGLAVAPVPDLALYDSIYQERYMGLPQENAESYRANSPITFAENLRGELLLVHGTGDDNVHFQGTERLINRLVELGKPFELMVYPNRSHAVSEGRGTQRHVFSLLGRYLLERLPAR